MEIPFLKKIAPARDFSFKFFAGKPSNTVGIDIGAYSTKVVQLRYEKERGILETYGELLSEGYFKGSTSGFTHYADSESANLLKDILRESKITSKEAIFSVPSGSSFVTTIPFPPVPEKELKEAIPFEARRYVPIPISEVVLDWEVLGATENREHTEVLLIAVPREVVEKFKRLSGLSGLSLRALEIEAFGMVRSLGVDHAPAMFLNFGHQSTTLAIADKGRLRVSHNFSRGSAELTKSLERGLGISRERAENLKKEVGLSEKAEEQEISSVIAPFIETLLSEVDRFLSIYNRKAPRTVQKINITGGGSNLKGLIERMVSKFGVEITRGNPFSRIASPPFMQPILREIGPSFAVANGLALREITSK